MPAIALKSAVQKCQPKAIGCRTLTQDKKSRVLVHLIRTLTCTIVGSSDSRNMAWYT